jgi:Mor family transcriptional regulator
MPTDDALFLPTVPTHEILENICSFLPDTICHNTVKVAIIKAQAGHLVYIPKHLLAEIRNNEMMDKFDGGNMREICIEYRVSKMHFYRILKRYRNRKKVT